MATSGLLVVAVVCFLLGAQTYATLTRKVYRTRARLARRVAPPRATRPTIPARRPPPTRGHKGWR